MKTVLTIAGSDSSAGAGIQADLKTISALGAYAATVITAVTAQNTLGVQAVHAVPADIVAKQIASVMEDLRPEAVKIGMLPTADIVRTVTDCLQRYCPQFVVFDPVMVSTSGRTLMPIEAVDEAMNRLIPISTLITPNLNEAALLLARGTTGKKQLGPSPLSMDFSLSVDSEVTTLSTIAHMEKAACTLARRLGTSVLVKGGHLAGDRLCDILCHDGQSLRYPTLRIATSNLHGTGCTLSSAIATHLALGLSLPQAVERSTAYLRQAISAARDFHIGQGNGPLHHFFTSTAIG